MRQSKYILLLFLIVPMLTSCFNSYEPIIAGSDISKFVVSGQVTDQSGNQTITISTSSSINKPEEIPVKGCTVTISDDQGHRFPMADSANGTYHGWIDTKHLAPGSSFMVEVLTPDGSKIVSDFDNFSSCPKVDSLYYIRKDVLTSDPLHPQQGIQFYVDLNGENTDSRYYRWDAVETWEYHSEYPIEWFYDGNKEIHIFPPNYSLSTCWKTILVGTVFTLSTKNLAENKYQQQPLHFVDNTTQRLLYGYSLLVNQYSLSEAAYKYWNMLRINSTEAGGLYERQPMASKGNLHNLTHPDQDVLGFFGVSSVNSKRIFIKKVENLDVEYLSNCFPAPMSGWGWDDYLHIPKPIYFLRGSKGGTLIMNKECVDCTALFGKTVKPYFWPN